MDLAKQAVPGKALTGSRLRFPGGHGSMALQRRTVASPGAFQADPPQSEGVRSQPICERLAQNACGRGVVSVYDAYATSALQCGSLAPPPRGIERKPQFVNSSPFAAMCEPTLGGSRSSRRPATLMFCPFAKLCREPPLGPFTSIQQLP
jgi:hypothetical protein